MCWSNGKVYAFYFCRIKIAILNVILCVIFCRPFADNSKANNYWNVFSEK